MQMTTMKTQHTSMVIPHSKNNRRY